MIEGPRIALPFAKVRDGFEVGRQPSGEPNQLDVALGLALQTTAGLRVSTP
jgi:hypothetical protein